MDNDKCFLCPRRCGADRAGGELGACGVGADIRLARAALHPWEEPCISGNSLETGVGGSGTVFFSGCSLSCVFCQNSHISHGNFGKVISKERLVNIFLELQEKGAYNINLVTGAPYTNSIIDSVYTARQRGLSIPIVYNSSGYECTQTIKSLEKTVDIYMPDLKYLDNALAQKYSKAYDYPEYAVLAIDEMVRQKGECRFDKNGIMQSGVLIRHLMLPGCLKDSMAVIKHVYERYGDRVYLSLMSQYTPFGDLAKFPELKSPLPREDYNKAVDYAISLGLENGFLQEEEADKESFIPPFDLTGV